MHLRIDPHNGVPLGLQIVRQIRLAISAGRLSAGDRLPSARDLSAQLGVNFHTVRKAYGDLERLGLLRLERGKGTHVVDGARTFTGRDLRGIVREHLERLAEDLAGSDTPPEELQKLIHAREAKR